MKEPLDSQQQHELMLQVKSGVENAMNPLFEAYRKTLYSFFYHMCQDTDKSKDLVQNVFVKVWKYRRKYEGTGSFKGWIFQIARNVYNDDYRKLKRQQAREQSIEYESVYEPYQQFENKEEAKILHEKIARLSEEQREALVLVKLHEMKYREVAQLLNTPESTIKIRVFRAIRALQKMYQQTAQ